MSNKSDKSNNIMVTRETILGEVANKYPEAARIMLEYGLHCVGCFANQFDTVEQGAMLHSLSDEEIDEMVFRVNEAIRDPLVETRNS